MKRVCIVWALILTLFLFCGCGGYVKSYSATILITSCHGNEANMEFDSFKGPKLWPFSVVLVTME